MLVLKRHLGETIIIDDNIRITVIGITGSRVRLGITAPSSVTVDREEVLRRRMYAGPDEGGSNDPVMGRAAAK